MAYLILTRPQAAYGESISRELFRLSRPDTVRDPADVTTYYCGWIAHPVDGRVALDFPDDGELPVHPAADENRLPDLIQAAISGAEHSKARADIANVKGRRGDPLALLPASLTANLRTREQLEAAGWFPDLP